MDSFGGDMRFEMEGVPPHSHPQTSLEPSSLYTARINSQLSITLPQDIPALDQILNNSMNFALAKPHAIFDSETSLQSPTDYINGTIMSPGDTSAHNFSLFRQNSASLQSQNSLRVLGQPLNLQQPAQSLTRKRAPKAPTMSAKNWEPHKNRIRQLYVSDGKSIGELRDIMNKELGITATLRQYKVRIQQMKLERNGKANERKAVVKHIQHREHVVGKKSSHVRIRGHEISQERLFRWAKENLMDQPSMFTRPPSPLPSCISIFTNSVCEPLQQSPPVISKNQQLLNGFTTVSDMTSNLTQRLLKYAQCTKPMIESQEARAVFNDLQLILRNDFTVGKRWNEDHWNHNVKEDIIQVRNWMNVTQALLVSGELKETRRLVPANEIRDQDTNLPKVPNRHAAWNTPYGRVQGSFWIESDHSYYKTPGDTTSTANKTVAARLAIIPSSIGTSPFRVVIDFTPHLDPSATITYQAMIPNDSEVFKIAHSGEVKELLELLEKGTVSLTDRDEEGRSLLNYAISGCNVDMSNFLVDNKADMNAIEPDWNGFIRPVYSVFEGLDAESEEITRHKRARCIQITLKAGADFSLEMDEGGGIWENAFVDAVISTSLEVVKHILDFGEPFISPNGIYKTPLGDSSALKILANCCGYYYGSVIDVVEKAILLLNRKADISIRNEHGDTVLHTLLKCERLHERELKKTARMWGYLDQWDLSIKAPRDLLMVFITAGADVYATSHDGKTPSTVASEYGREDEWIKALELCGYESGEVLTSCIHNPTREHQTSKLAFQEYCQQRKQQQHRGPFEQIRSEYIDNDSQYDDEDEDDGVLSEDSDESQQYDDEDEYDGVQSEDSDDSQYGDENVYEEDDHEQRRGMAGDTECGGGGGNMEIFGSVECIDCGMEFGFENEGEEQKYNAEEMVEQPVLGLEDVADNYLEEMEINLDEWLDNGVDFMQSFNEFGMSLDTSFE